MHLSISSTSSNEQVNQTLEYRLLEDLNAAMGSSYALSDHQILIYHGKDFPEGSTLQIDGSDFTVVTLPESDSVNATSGKRMRLLSQSSSSRTRKI